MMDLTELKKTARHAAFARRKTAHAGVRGTESALLSELLAGYRGASLSGYLPIRTEIDPLPAMAEAAAHGVVAVPVIMGAGLPLCFSRWSPGIALRAGPFGASVPENDDFMEPEILIVPLVAFDGEGGRLGYGGGFYDRTLEMLRRKRPTLAVGFAFDLQQTVGLPLEETDQPLDFVVTESRVLTFSKKEAG